MNLLGLKKKLFKTILIIIIFLFNFHSIFSLSQKDSKRASFLQIVLETEDFSKLNKMTANNAIHAFVGRINLENESFLDSIIQSGALSFIPLSFFQHINLTKRYYKNPSQEEINTLIQVLFALSDSLLPDPTKYQIQKLTNSQKKIQIESCIINSKIVRDANMHKFFGKLETI
ncbi:MAG: hypothetical protein ABIA04_02010 [Pseudomonadota bacterium]